MEQVRQVSLMNENGEVVNCMLRSSFLNDLGGLGYEQDITYLNYGDGFYAPVKSSHKQGQISGRLSFIDRDTAYADYRKLMSWISYSETLRKDRSIQFCYAPYNGERFMRNVILTNVSKGEIDIGGYLSCDVGFIALTPWYKQTDLHMDSELTPANVAGWTLPLTLEADMECRYQITLTGTFTNVVISLRDSGNNLIGICDLSAGVSIASGEALIFSTLPDNIGVWKRLGNGTLTNVLDSLTFTDGLPVFFTLPPRENIRVLVRAASASETCNGDMTIYSYWRTR